MSEDKYYVIPTKEPVMNLAYGVEGKVTEEFKDCVYVELPTVLAFTIFYTIASRWGWWVEAGHDLRGHEGAVTAVVNLA